MFTFHFQMKLQAIRDEENSKLKFDMKHSKPLPDFVVRYYFVFYAINCS